jgi:ubiquinone/menaquinone biosynthesis C-methylase UbiE
MEDKQRMPDEIVGYYQERQPENTRIVEGMGQLEYLRTQEIVRRYLPCPEGARPLDILDVGGANGIHAEWLAADGHRVHLIDPVPLHVQQARERAASLEQPFTCEQGDARALSQSDASVDVVLLLGPLYHLQEEADRVLGLSEARRVLRPGGLVFGAAISRFASLFDGIAYGMLFDPEFRQIVQQDLRDGRHHNPTAHPGWFTTAYFHLPEQLADEARMAGLTVHAVLGVEGMATWFDMQLAERWKGPADRELILDTARAIESEPALLGLSAHLLLVGEKPDGSEARLPS